MVGVRKNHKTFTWYVRGWSPRSVNNRKDNPCELSPRGINPGSRERSEFTV